MNRKGMHVADQLITVPAHLSASSKKLYYRSKFTDSQQKKIFLNLVTVHRTTFTD